MLDHLSGGQRAEPRRRAMILTAREANQESGGEQIARPGRIDHLVDRRRGDRDGLAILDSDCALRPLGDDQRRNMDLELVEC